MSKHLGNNFDIFRLFLASIVVLVHVYAATQSNFYSGFDHYFSGDFAVKCFFVISGILVSRSYFSSGRVSLFYAKRFLRIYPAYIFIVFFAFLLGAFISDLGFFDYFGAKASWSYLFFNSILLNFVSPGLPGVFLDNKISAINTSLWTIKVEVALYFFLPAFVWLMRVIGNFKGAFLLLLPSILWVLYFKEYSSLSSADELARQFPGQISFFIIGVLFSSDDRCKSKVAWVLVASSILYFLLKGTILRWVIEPFFFASLVIYFCCLAPVILERGVSDVSYGIYLFHFPLIQVFVLFGLFAEFPVFGLILLFCLILALAFFSWNFIEKPFLKGGAIYNIIFNRANSPGAF